MHFFSKLTIKSGAVEVLRTPKV